MNISIEDFQNLVSDNGDPDMAFSLGELSEKHNDIASAIKHYSNALAYDNTFSRAYFKRAKCFTKAKQYDRAIVDYKNFIQFLSESDKKSLSNVHFEIAQLQGEKGDFKNALSSIIKSIENNPLNVPALELRGTIYVQLGDTEKAISDYLDVEKLDNTYFNNSPNILLNLPLLDEGMALETKIILTERAVIVNPDYELGYFNLGIFYKKSKQLDKAIEAFKFAHEKNPHSLDNLNQLCQCLADCQDYERLKMYLEKLVALGDQSAKQNLDSLNDYLTNKMKTIKVKMENRSSGPGRANDDLWESWKLLDNGTFQESEENFILTNQKGEIFIALKKSELFAAKIYNQHLSIDLKNFELYEGENPTGGYFILYRLRAENRRNVFMIAGIFGIAGGSSINFETL